MSTSSDHRYPGLLADLIVIVGDSLVKDGYEKEGATRAAHLAAEQLRKLWGGHFIYVPKGKGYDISKRDLQLYSEFNGRNIPELVRKYNLSEPHVYKIIEKVKAADVEQRQTDAFDGKNGDKQL